MGTQRKKHSRLWAYLLYLGLVTSLILSVTLARYASNASGAGTATVAAMAGGGEPIRMVLDDMLPGDEGEKAKKLEFQVVNYKGDAVSEVALDYEITVETTGNLPLVFTLTAEKAPGTDSAGTMVKTGVILADGNTQTLTGGTFPLTPGETGNKPAKQAHTYTLEVEWPAGNSDAGYADEIDLVSVSVTAQQRLGS